MSASAILIAAYLCVSWADASSINIVYTADRTTSSKIETALDTAAALRADIEVRACFLSFFCRSGTAQGTAVAGRLAGAFYIYRLICLYV